MKALYRQYRPKTLSEVVGQDHIITPLENALKSGKFSHAYLFTGPRGCGKTSVARIFAHLVNGFPYELEDTYVDVIEIDAASNTGVDNIRDLREKAAIAPTSGKYKVYIIDEVHMLSKSAFNALLKTLEEPPQHVIFLLATTDPEKVPITITSRTQVYQFRLAPPDVLVPHLEKIAKKAEISIEIPALELIAEKSGGSFRDALSLLDQISTLSNSIITRDTLVSALRLPSETLTHSLLAAYQSADLATIASLLQEAKDNSTDPLTLASDLIELCIKNFSPALSPLLNSLTSITSPFADAKLLLALTENISSNIKNPTPLAQPASSAPTPEVQPIPSTPIKEHPHPSIIPQITEKVNPPAPALLHNSKNTEKPENIKNFATGVKNELYNKSHDENASTKEASSEYLSSKSPAPQEKKTSTLTPDNSKNPPSAKSPTSEKTTPIPDAPNASNVPTTPTSPSTKTTATATTVPDTPVAPTTSTPSATATTAVPDTPVAPVTSSVQTTPTPFSWQTYLTTLKSSSATVYLRLKNCPYYYDDTTHTLHLHPEKSIDKSIFTHSNNHPLLLRALPPSTKLEIHDIDDPAPTEFGQKSKKNTSPISQISAIMGRGIKEVKPNDGEIPF